jgi:L,D-transpeptidase YbiS
MKAKTAAPLLTAGIIILGAVVHPGLGYRWSEPEPSADSLALEARRKLRSLSGRFLENGKIKMIQRASAQTRSREIYITIDTHTNRLYLRRGDRLLLSALCSTGTGAELVDTEEGRRWEFDTPKGFFRVDSKLDNPWWRKPDWAFIEEGEPVPEENDDERFDPYAMGDYALGFGDGYFIHGTILERLIGVSVTHGCVRLRSGDLKRVYESVEIKTPVIIF